CKLLNIPVTVAGDVAKGKFGAVTVLTQLPPLATHYTLAVVTYRATQWMQTIDGINAIDHIGMEQAALQAVGFPNYQRNWLQSIVSNGMDGPLQALLLTPIALSPLSEHIPVLP